MSEEKLSCQNLKKKLDSNVGVNGKHFKKRSDYSALMQGFCGNKEKGEFTCEGLFSALDLILNPENKEFNSNWSFATALGEVCQNKKRVTEDGWLEVLGELIGSGIDSTSSAWEKQYQAQQSGASNVAMALSLGPAAGIGERPFGPLLLFR